MQTGFFNVLSVPEFITRLREFPQLEQETVTLLAADGRVLASELHSPEDLPLASRSCMDGYALNAKDIFGASETNPTYLECIGTVDIAHPADFTVQQGECAAIVTGGILPQGTDAVIMVEHTEELGAGTIEMRKSLAPGEHVMLRGEDVTRDATALTQGTLLRPQEVGLLAALGITEIPVVRRPSVGILSTGDELIPVTETPRTGQIRDVNSYTLACLIERIGCTARQYGIVKDDLDSLSEAMQKALAENDVIFLSGGSSVGTRDLTVSAIDQLALCKDSSITHAELINHGVAISPGKPLILAKAETTAGVKAIWGLPGQVASAQVVMFILGIPFLKYLAGESSPFDQAVWPARRAVLSRNIASRQGREDYIRVRLEPASATAEQAPTPDAAATAADTLSAMLPEAAPVTGKSGLLRTMLLSEGVVRIPAESEGLYAGTEIDVLLFQQ